MTPISFGEAVRRSIQNDPRYHPAAYELVRDALHVAAKKFRDENAEDQHVSGQELLAGFREHVLSEYGPMSNIILDQWGLQRGEDVGNIVYNLIECGYFGKNDGDSIEDFAGGYDFATAFTNPFLPSSQREPREKKSS
ncbi:Minf_1886 family protein [Prosthecobacter vanneervenii]|uniref:Putative repeat protein (TIGR04138 family) n=1 Tax=Prosthecobacter vanneervenii TaxID=48466 RepID=A0A7W7YC34_9BACT|nr:Minf_1886 family protein [Prosthecobacter vanneervenii]MBB5033448.1 putative repeat protein (TIGR04138 family) [Prosthecobacter vanneervenii]